MNDNIFWLKKIKKNTYGYIGVEFLTINFPYQT